VLLKVGAQEQVEAHEHQGKARKMLKGKLKPRDVFLLVVEAIQNSAGDEIKSALVAEFNVHVFLLQTFYQLIFIKCIKTILCP
jgi:hypothetical protein